MWKEEGTVATPLGTFLHLLNVTRKTTDWLTLLKTNTNLKGLTASNLNCALNKKQHSFVVVRQNGYSAKTCEKLRMWSHLCGDFVTV